MRPSRARPWLPLVGALCAALQSITGGPRSAPASAADHNDVAGETVVFGSSVEGAPLVAHHRWGAGEATFRILVVGVIHGDETAGLDVVDLLLDQTVPDGVDLWLVPNANPDGTAHRRRGNANGVDLNRNFPTDWEPYGSGEFTVGGYDPGPEPGSEPETQALMDFIVALQPSYTIWFHQPWDAVVCNSFGGARCPAYAAAVGRPTMTAPRPGSATSWQAANGLQGAVVEFGEGAISAAEADRHAAAVLRLAETPTETGPPAPVAPGAVTTTSGAPPPPPPPPEPEPAPVAPPQLGDDALVVVERNAADPAGAETVDLVGYVRNGGSEPLVATWAWWAPCLDQPARVASQPVPAGAQLTMRCRLAPHGPNAGLAAQWSVSLTDSAGSSLAAEWATLRLGSAEPPERIGA